MKISGRNKLKGVVKQVEKDTIMAKVKIEIIAPATITALISREAVDELNLKPGDKAEALIKATEVMILTE
jgi:molybdate transport system regulatory protein